MQINIEEPISPEEARFRAIDRRLSKLESLLSYGIVALWVLVVLVAWAYLRG